MNQSVGLLFSVLLCLPVLASQAMLSPVRQLPAMAYTATLEKQNLTLLSAGVASFRKRLQMVESATKTIDTEFYIYHSDAAGRIFSQALVRKAKAGVRVRVLVDRGYGNLNLNPLEAQVLVENGIEFKYYNDISLLRFKRANHRSHRKSLIVDGQAAVVGGRNMSEDYFDFSPEYNMMDQDVLVEGSIVGPIQESFEAFWNSKLSKPAPKFSMPTLADYGFGSEEEARSTIAGEKILRRLQREKNEFRAASAKAKSLVIPSGYDLTLSQRVAHYGDKLLAETPTETCSETYYISDLPGNGEESRVVYDHISQFLKTAQKSLLIESPFFIRTESKSLVQDAVDRGVQVDVLTNSLYSAKVALSVAPILTYASELTRGGAGVYVYEGDSPRWLDFSDDRAKTARWGSHGKLLVIDQDSFSIGSFNMDPRSAFHNAEMTLICRGQKKLASILAYEFDLRKTIAVKLDRNANPVDGRTKFFNVDSNKKFLYYLTKPFAHLFESML